jgi:hypothetical protein
VLLGALVGFIGGGLKAGESAIVIAAAEHLKALEERFQVSNLDVAKTRSRDQYITEEALARFMAKQWPDNKLFGDLVFQLIMRGRANSRRVRAFGEVVAPYGQGMIKQLPVDSNIRGIRYGRVERFHCSMRIQSQIYRGESTNQICAAHSRVI